MIFLFTDFGDNDIYVGQMHAAIANVAPQLRVIDLFHNVPNFNLRAGAYLLSALANTLPDQAIVVAVVDPGVGGRRDPLLLEADGRWFVGPDNGLFSVLVRQAADVKCFRIQWRPATLSESFHGRDLFAPVAARLATGGMPERVPREVPTPNPSQWPDALYEVIYIDHYGNAMTGIPSGTCADDTVFAVRDGRIAYARTFCEVPEGAAFWYRNSLRRVEFAVNGGRACDVLALTVGNRVVEL